MKNDKVNNIVVNSIWQDVRQGDKKKYGKFLSITFIGKPADSEEIYLTLLYAHDDSIEHIALRKFLPGDNFLYTRGPYVEEDETVESKTMEFLTMLEEFINHNIKLTNISPLTTVEDLLFFVGNLKTNYIPLLEEITKYTETLSK